VFTKRARLTRSCNPIKYALEKIIVLDSLFVSKMRLFSAMGQISSILSTRGLSGSSSLILRDACPAS
jgi:hypothetical protein